MNSYHINIARMQVGQDENGAHNIIFMQTDTPIDAKALADLQQLDSVTRVQLLEF